MKLFIGDEGEGTLNIEAGGAVTNTQGFVGNQDGSSGDVTVQGPGSTWTNSEFVVVGFFGDGSLSVLDGGQILNPAGSASIGNRSVSTGTVLVDGQGSSWTNDFTFFVGFEGTGELTIQNGGLVSNTGSDTTIALMEGSHGTVLVDGPGSSWTNDVLFSIGADGTAELTITNGGSVSNTGSQTLIGGSSGSTGTVTVDGTDSEFDVAATPLVVGVLGTANLNIGNGGAAHNAEATVGDGPLSRGTVSVGRRGFQLDHCRGPDTWRSGLRRLEYS